MTKLKIFLSFALLAFHQNVFAQSSHEAAVERLFQLVDVEAAMQQSMDQMMAIQIEANPMLAPFENTIMTFLKKHVSYDSIKGEMIQLYTGHFTETEINELVLFYETPVGQKALQSMPELMRRGSEIGFNRVRANSAELQAMIAEEAQRLAEEAQAEEAEANEEPSALPETN